MAKIAQEGTSILSNTELLSVVMGISKEQADLLWKQCNCNFAVLAKMTLTEICKNGITPLKATKLLSIFEINRRRRLTPDFQNTKIKSSQDAFKILHPLLEDLKHEEFWILILNRANFVIDIRKISQGGIAGTVTDIKIILNTVLEKLGSGLILAHNHPSGNLKSSEADIKITKKVKQACELIDVSLLDHIIIGGSNYLSLTDDNLMPF